MAVGEPCTELSCERGRLATGGSISPPSWKRGSRSGKPGGWRDAASISITETETYGNKMGNPSNGPAAVAIVNGIKYFVVVL